MTEAVAHKYQPGQIVTAKASGKAYLIERLRSDDHRKHFARAVGRRRIPMRPIPVRGEIDADAVTG